MWKHRHVLREKEGEGKGGAGGAPEITPEVQALIDAAVEKSVTGLKGKNTELLGKLREANDNLKKFDGIDPEAVNSLLKRFADDEEAGLLKAGKLDEVINKRVERMKAGFEKETAAERKAREAAEARAKKYSQRVLENHIRAEASAAGIHKHAVDDALFRANTVFDLSDDGDAAPREGFFGKDGKPLTLKEWFAEMKEKAPHWWPATQGGGAPAAGGGSPSGKTATRAQFDSWSDAERMAFSKAGGKLKD